MTKIFKISLALCLLWFAVPYFYHSYLDNQIFRKIEKEYCEKDAGLMVFVDKIDFSQPIVIIYEGENKNLDDVVSEHSIEIGYHLNLFKAFNRKEIYLDLRLPNYKYIAKRFDKNKKLIKETYTNDRSPISPGVYKQIVSPKCFDRDKNNIAESVNGYGYSFRYPNYATGFVACLPEDFTLSLSEMPTQGILIKTMELEERVVFNDYLINEYSYFGQDIATQKILFSFKAYTYFGTTDYAKTYNFTEEAEGGLFGSSVSPPNIHHCAGENNLQSIKQSGNTVYSNFKFLKENYGYQ